MLYQDEKTGNSTHKGCDSSEPSHAGLEGKKGRHNDHRSSSRYISDPTGRQTTKTSDKTEAVRKHDTADLEMALPVTEDDYLQPQTSANSSAYVDVVSDNGSGKTAFHTLSCMLFAMQLDNSNPINVVVLSSGGSHCDITRVFQ
jgi:hypothetical protein